MNSEVKAEWVRRLRSGEYRKGTIYQKTKSDQNAIPCYCILGVLNQIAVDKGIAEESFETWWDGRVVYHFNSPGKNSEHLYVPRSVIRWSGIPHDQNEGKYIPLQINGVTRCITHWNDSTNLTFKELADAIEAQY